MLTNGHHTRLLPQNTLLNESRVAQQLDCEQKTLQAWRCRGGGPPYVKIGSLVRYKPQDVLDWIEQRRVANTGER